MKTFTIDEQNNITAFGTAEEAVATTTTPFDSFGNQMELAQLAGAWPADRLVAIWNSLPGVKTVKAFKSPKAGVSRIWERIQGLGDPEKPKAKLKTKGDAQGAKGAPARKPAKAPTLTKKLPKKGGKMNAEVRPGSKTAHVVAMLQRKNGATLAEIVEQMGWQKHTVRGFMAGAMKKAGHVVESFKSDKGERTYRLNH